MSSDHDELVTLKNDVSWIKSKIKGLQWEIRTAGSLILAALLANFFKS